MSCVCKCEDRGCVGVKVSLASVLPSCMWKPNYYGMLMETTMMMMMMIIVGVGVDSMIVFVMGGPMLFYVHLC